MTPSQGSSTGQPRHLRCMVVDRGVDLILVCGAGTAAPFFGGTEAPITLYGKLVTGAPPNWLTPVSIPEGAAGGFLVYRL